MSDVRPLEDVPESWPVGSSTDLHRDDWVVALRSDQVSRCGDPHEFSRLVFEHPGAVMILAVDEQERALVLHQYRHAAQMRFAELPAGLRDDAGEEPLAAARRELLEETQLVATEWSHLLSTYPSPGFSSEKVEIYLAKGLTEAADRGDFELIHEEADMTASWVSVDDLLDGVVAGRLTDACTQLAVLTYTLSRSSRRRDDIHIEQEPGR